MYSAKIVADSISAGFSKVRLTTMEVVMPRIILAEFNTHRVFSRNSASSRAIPVEKRIKQVKANPFVPEAFASNKKGMQAGENLSKSKNWLARTLWIASMHLACLVAGLMARVGVHKQWANRIIEPYCWQTVIVTATEWENFFALRLSPEAQPEIRRVAELMKKAMDESTPKILMLGQWHLPMISGRDVEEITLLRGSKHNTAEVYKLLAKISSARCARVSYLTHDGKRDLDADLKLADRLLTSGHMSPFEHVARHEMTYTPAGNFKSPWLQYRKTLAGEAVFGCA